MRSFGGSKYRPKNLDEFFWSRSRPRKNLFFLFLDFSRFFGESKSRPKKSDQVFFWLDLDHQEIQTVVAVVAAGTAVVPVVAADAAVVAVVV